MLKSTKTNTLLLLAVGFLAGIAVVQGVSLVFAHGGDTALIHACVKNSNGSITIVGASTSCGAGETALDWNIQGVQGIQGIQGETGPEGPAGPGGEYADFPFVAPESNLSGHASQFINRDFSFAMLNRSRFLNSDVHGVIFDNAQLDSFGFINSDLTGASFRNADMSSPSMYQTDFTNADFTGAYLGGNGSMRLSNFTGADFTNANLERANYLETSTLTGAIWDNTICPDETNSDNNGDTCIGHWYIEE